MEILNITVHSTLNQELFLCLLTLGFVPIITFFMLGIPDKLPSKKVRIIAIIIDVIIILLMWIACLSRVYEYETIEVKVYDWNEIINSEEFKLVEYKGNKATLTRVLE